MRWIRIVPSLPADCVTFINDFLRKAGSIDQPEMVVRARTKESECLDEKIRTFQVETSGWPVIRWQCGNERLHLSAILTALTMKSSSVRTVSLERRTPSTRWTPGVRIDR